MVAGAEFGSCGRSKQNYVPLPHPIHHRPRSEPQAPPAYARTPRANSFQIRQPAQVTPVRGSSAALRVPRSGSRDHGTVFRGSWSTTLAAVRAAFGPRTSKIGLKAKAHGSRSVDHGPKCLALGPRTMAVIQTVIQNRALADRC
jgi:hypothetical protein